LFFFSLHIFRAWLKAKNVYSAPFQQFCDKCKQPLPMFSAECIICKENTVCKFQHHVECTLETDDGIIDCVLRMPQLQQVCPEIARLTYDTYLKSISSSIYHLRQIRLTALFTLTIDNFIIEVKQL